MNNIAARSSETRANNINNRPAETVETAGSLAMNQFHSLFETNVYDVFSSSNPFSVDYSQYSDTGAAVAYTGGFLSSFSNAVSTLTSSGSFSNSGTFSGASCGGGFSGSSCSGSSGGFTSVC